MKRSRSVVSATFLFSSLIAGAAFTACGPPQEPTVPSGGGVPSGSAAPSASAPASPSASASAPAAGAPFADAMKDVAPTQMLAELQQIGIDPKNPPPLGKLEPQKLRSVMKLFAKALGSKKCTDLCHVDDMAAPTPNKKVAERMWNEYVRGLSFQDGSPLFCDSCHQGRAKQLDRRDKKALSHWMDENFVGKLARKDRKEHECATCHGDPPEYLFLDGWRAAKR